MLAGGDIADGSLPPETQLPPEEGLIERFKVSRTTVRKAIQNLVERGLVEVRRGRGTFVTQPKITQELTELSVIGAPRPRFLPARMNDGSYRSRDISSRGRHPKRWCKRFASLAPDANHRESAMIWSGACLTCARVEPPN